MNVAQMTPPLVNVHRGQTVTEVERQSTLGRPTGQMRAAVPWVGETVPAVRLYHVVVTLRHVIVANRSNGRTVCGSSNRRLIAIHLHCTTKLPTRKLSIVSKFFCTLQYTVRQRAYVIYDAIIYRKRPLLRLRPLPSNNELSPVKTHYKSAELEAENSKEVQPVWSHIYIPC